MNQLLWVFFVLVNLQPVLSIPMNPNAPIDSQFAVQNERRVLFNETMNQIYITPARRVLFNETMNQIYIIPARPDPHFLTCLFCIFRPEQRDWNKCFEVPRFSLNWLKQFYPDTFDFSTNYLN